MDRLHHLRVSARPAPPAVPALNRVERRQNPAADARAAVVSPAGRILLASIIGMAICTFWIATTWRAWG